MLLGAPQQNAGPRPSQSNRDRATPISLQTNALGSHSARYSYTDTPTELQRPTFQRSSSPANSMIEESPTHSHPQEESFSHHTSHAQNTQFPVEKIPVSRSGTPYNFEPPPEEHPALSVPFAESTTSPKAAQFTEARHSAGPLPNKIDEHPMSLLNSPTYMQSKTEPTKASSASDHTPIFYNPDSLAGPNVALDNHRPGQVSHPNAAIEPKWKHGLCEIDTVCCTGLCCPCVLYGKTQYRLSRKGQRQDPTDLLSYEPVNGSCGIMAVACGFQCKFSVFHN
jgi:hypothetical protein